jgi:endo-1,4-beta-xylanase
MHHSRGGRAPIARRRVLAAGLAAAASGLVAPFGARAEAAGPAALRRLAADKGLLYGTTIAASQIDGDPAFVDLVLRQADIVVPENDMKWLDMNQGAPGKDDFDPGDTVAGFAVEGNLALRGHNVLWYFRTPWWYFDLPGRAAQERAVVDRIQALVGRYRGLVHSWDVVNEPIEPKDGRADGLRKAVFLETLGPGYLDLVYRVARETDPGARLVVNEYDIELDTPEHETRRRTLLALLERMRRAGTPVDAVGIEAHLIAVGGPPFSGERLRRFFADLAALGLKIQITELDVTDENAPADTPTRDRVTADAYRRFLEPALDEPAVEMVLTWGLSDRYSWIVRQETHESRWRKDGAVSRPLPFDADLRPKPAYDALVQAFAQAPARPVGRVDSGPARP